MIPLQDIANDDAYKQKLEKEREKENKRGKKCLPQRVGLKQRLTRENDGRK